MKLPWPNKAFSELARLYEFLAVVNKPAAAQTIQSLTAAQTGLRTNPRIGEKLQEVEARAVRRMILGPYEFRYEIVDSTIYILRLWHTREDR